MAIKEIMKETEIKKLKKEMKEWDINENGLIDLGKGAIGQATSIGGKEIITKGKVFDYYDEEKEEYHLKIKNKSVTVFTGEGRNIDDVIKSDADYRRMMRLILKHMGKDNKIILKTSKNVKAIPATIEGISLLLDMPEKKARDFIGRMKKLNIVKKDSFGCFYINPVYTMATKGIKIETYMLFKKELDEVLPKQAIQDLQTLIYYDVCPDELNERIIEIAKEKNIDDDTAMECIIKDGRKYEPITDENIKQCLDEEILDKNYEEDVLESARESKRELKKPMKVLTPVELEQYRKQKELEKILSSNV